MEFYKLLKIGGSPEQVAESFVTQLLQLAHCNNSYWIHDAAAIFIQQFFDAIGLRTKVTAAQLKGLEEPKWREDNLAYIFSYNSYSTVKIESFLLVLATKVDNIEKSVRDAAVGDEIRATALPVYCYLQVLRFWAYAARSLYQGSHATECCDKFFREPIARISYFLLKSLLPLHQKYVMDYSYLKRLCLLLWNFAKFGIYYEGTNKLVLNGLFELMTDYSALLLNDDYKFWSFISYGLISEKKSSSAVALFQKLTDLMQNWEKERPCAMDGTPLMRLLTNNLVNENFLSVCCVLLKDRKIKTLSLAVLKFIDELQRHLVSCDCFNEDFLAVFLITIINQESIEVRKLSAKLYMAIAQRLQPNHIILRHIFITFLKTKAASNRNADIFKRTLHNYLIEFCILTPMMRQFCTYLTIMHNAEARREVHLLAAHATVILFEMYQHEMGNNTPEGVEIIAFINGFFDIVKDLSTDLATIVLNVLVEFKDYKRFLRKVPNGRQMLIKIENFALDIFLKNELFEMCEPKSFLCALTRILIVTGNTNKLHNIAMELKDKFNDMTNLPVPWDINSFEQYYYTIFRLNIILQMQSNVIIACNLFDVLRANFLTNSICNDLIVQTKYRVDCIAFELMATCAVYLRGSTYYDQENLHTHVRLMSNQLFTLLSKADDKDIEMKKSIFIALVLLHIGFAPPLSQGSLYLSRKTYNLLLETLTFLINTKNIQKKPKEYNLLRHMFFAFQRLLTVEHIKLPNATIWKLILHYSLNKSFNEDLKEIVKLLLSKRTSHYAETMPVLIHKLNFQTPALSEVSIGRALIAHRKIIDEILSPRNAWSIKLHCVLSTIELIVKSVSLDYVGTHASKINRLLTLRGLLKLLDKMKLSANDFTIIYTTTREISQYTLYRAEHKLLKQFMKAINQLKRKCLFNTRARRVEEEVMETINEQEENMNEEDEDNINEEDENTNEEEEDTNDEEENINEVEEQNTNVAEEYINEQEQENVVSVDRNASVNENQAVPSSIEYHNEIIDQIEEQLNRIES